MITLILCALLAVFIADAVYARARTKLRIRAAEAATQQPSHHLTNGTDSAGWRSLSEEAAERAGAAQVADNPLASVDRIIGNNVRRGSGADDSVSSYMSP